MKLIPYDTFTLQTSDSLPQVIQRLEAYIEPATRFRGRSTDDRPRYQGTLSNSGFEISRIINYRNSFLPIIRGRFESSGDGTRIHITMRLHSFVLFFLLFWCSAWFTPIIPMILVSMFLGDLPLEALFFVGLPIAVLCIFWWAFWSEANHSRRELTQIILGELVGESTLTHQTYNRSSIGYSILAIAAILISILWSVVPSMPRYFQPSTSLKECPQASPQSPYCNFSAFLTLTGYPAASTLALSADNKILVSGGRDKAIKVWDLPTGKLRQTLQSDSGTIEALAIAPDGRTVVSGNGDRMIRVWKIGSNKRPLLLKGHSSEIQQVRISPDSKTIVSTAYNELKVWDLTTGQLKAALPNIPPKEFKIGSVSIQKQPPNFSPLAIAPDCKTALVKFGNQLVSWDLQTNQTTLLKKANLFFHSLDTAFISQDGKTVMATSYQRPALHLRVWDLTTGTLQVETSFSSSPKQRGLNRNRVSAAIKADRLIGSTPEGLMVWNLKTAELEAILKEPPMQSLVVSPDGKYLAGIQYNYQLGNKTIKVLQRP